MIVASRYAKSLLDLSVEKGQLETVYADMKLIQSVCQSNKDFVAFLNSPVVKEDKKTEVLNSIFANNINAITSGFLNIIAKKRRESYVPQIAEAFIDQYKTHKKILTAVITSAVGLDEATKTKALELIKGQAKGEVELIEKIDPSVIGGFVLKIGDKQVDRTVSRQLANLKKNFSENPYISEL